jgi:hypothetical protein
MDVEGRDGLLVYRLQASKLPALPGQESGATYVSIKQRQ